MNRVKTILEPRPPFDFDLTATYATYFRGRYGADIFEGGVFRRLLDLGSCLALVSVRSLGSTGAPRLEVEIAGLGLDKAAVQEVPRQTA